VLAREDGIVDEGVVRCPKSSCRLLGAGRTQTPHPDATLSRHIISTVDTLSIAVRGSSYT